MFDTLTLPVPVTTARKSSQFVPVVRPLLSGRYEVILPDRNGVIFFTDSLYEAARHVARGRYGGDEKTGEILDFLTRVEELGFIGVGEYGVRVHRGDNSSQWVAKVRGTQPRLPPRYAINEAVEATDAVVALPPYLKAGRQLVIAGVVAVNDPRPGRQWVYTVGGGAGVRVSEDRLAPTDVTGVFDFEGLSD